MAKLLLIVPLQSQNEQFGRYHKGGGNNLPIGLLSIATFVRNREHDSSVLDCVAENFTDNDLRRFLCRGKWDIIGVQCFTNTVSNAKRTIEICKEVHPDTLCLLGGVHPTVMPMQTINEFELIDGLVVGEGELPIVEMLENIEKGNSFSQAVDGLVFRKSSGSIICNKIKRDFFDVNSYEHIDYSLLDLNKYTPHIINYKHLPSFSICASRGCPFNCAFCSAKFVNGRKIRYRSVNNVIREIQFLRQTYGCRDILFQDSTLMTDRNWIDELCDQLIRLDLDISFSACSRVDQIDTKLVAKLKKAGFWRLSFGIESYNQKSLRLIRKNVSINQNMDAIKMAHRAGMMVDATHIIGLPGENLTDAWNTVRTARKMASEYALFFLPVPYPKTDLYDICQKNGGIRKNSSWDDYSSIDFSNPVYLNPKIAYHEYISLCDKAHKYYYSSPKVLLKHFLSIRNLEDIIKYYKAFFSVYFGR